MQHTQAYEKGIDALLFDCQAGLLVETAQRTVELLGRRRGLKRVVGLARVERLAIVWDEVQRGAGLGCRV